MRLVKTLGKLGPVSSGLIGNALDIDEAHRLLTGPAEIVRVALPTTWPWVLPQLADQANTLRRTVQYRATTWPAGAVIGLRLEPTEIVAYAFVPGTGVAKTTRRGRPSPTSVRVIAQGTLIADQWSKLVIGGWAPDVLDDADTVTAVTSLIRWLRDRRYRVWGLGALGHHLARLKFRSPCPICGLPSRPETSFNPIFHEETEIIEGGLTHRIIVNKIYP